jgi:hypothetical protein
VLGQKGMVNSFFFFLRKFRVGGPPDSPHGGRPQQQWAVFGRGKGSPEDARGSDEE